MKIGNHILIVLAASIGIAIATSTARADTLYSNCTVVNVAYQNGVVGFICSGSAGWANAGATGSGCSTPVSVDTLKSWLSLAQAAFLSGKHLNFYYAGTCSGGAYQVTRVELVN